MRSKPNRHSVTPDPARRRATLLSIRTRSAGDSGAERLVYERVRLGVMSALAVRTELTFTELKSQFGVSDGNLSAHVRKLEEAGYVTARRFFEARRPKSVYRLSAAGRAALRRYLAHMEAVIRATRRV